MILSVLLAFALALISPLSSAAYAADLGADYEDAEEVLAEDILAEDSLNEEPGETANPVPGDDLEDVDPLSGNEADDPVTEETESLTEGSDEVPASDELSEDVVTSSETDESFSAVDEEISDDADAGDEMIAEETPSVEESFSEDALGVDVEVKELTADLLPDGASAITVYGSNSDYNFELGNTVYGRVWTYKLSGENRRAIYI